jgi:hypothetical protein
MNTATQETKVTAHQLWCNRLQGQLESILFPKKVQKGKHVFQTTREEVRRTTEQAIYVAMQFENTRLRVHVDEVIKLLNVASSECERLEKELKDLSPIRFRKRNKIRREHNFMVATREAFQQSVKIMVNTTPPEEAKPVMEVAK